MAIWRIKTDHEEGPYMLQGLYGEYWSWATTADRDEAVSFISRENAESALRSCRGEWLGCGYRFWLVRSR
jgi:hypothetical protein